MLLFCSQEKLDIILRQETGCTKIFHVLPESLHINSETVKQKRQSLIPYTFFPLRYFSHPHILAV
jgi:hypothetical protein